ncbi:MAG: hypothetical protein ACI4KM_10300 [Oscillospiraceae bacterium]
MSGEAEIIPGIIGAAAVGAVVIPVVVGGALIAGTVMAVRGLAGVTKGIATTAKKAHEENVRRRINSTYSKASGLLSETADIQHEIYTAMAQASDSVCESYTNTINSLGELFATEPDTTQFIERYESSKRAFSAEFEESMSLIEKRYASPMEAAANKTKALLETERAEVLASIEEIKGDMSARNERSKAAAGEIIDKTRTLICEFAESHKGNSHASDYSVSLTNALNTAIDRYNNGQYEAAIIDAYDTYSKCVTTVESLLAEDTKCEFLYEKCLAAITELEQHLDSTHFTDYDFSDTVDGQTVTYRDLDMTPYYFGAREAVQTQLEQIKSQFSSKDKYGFTSEELTDLITLTDNLNIQYIKDTATAYERLHNYLERIQYADIISATYMDLGFDEVEPDETASPLESLIVQMVEPSTGEVVKIYLNVNVDENSHISTGIDILTHSETLNASTEQQRNEQRETVCSSIMNSDFGKRKGIVATQRCKGGTIGKNAF